MRRPDPVMDTEGDVIIQRIVALIIDTLIVSVVSGILMVGLGILTAAAGSGGVAAMAMSILYPIVGLLTFIYFIYLEGAYGQTLGKKAMGIVVVNEDGSPVEYGASAIRNILRIIDAIGAYLVGLIVMVVTDRTQRIGDIVANTVVVEAE